MLVEELKQLRRNEVDTDEFNYYKQEQMGKAIEKIENDLYGDGKDPGIITRLALLEKASEHIVNTLDNVSKRSWAILGAIAFLILETTVKLLFHV